MPSDETERAVTRADWGGHSMVAPLQRVVVRRPGEAFGTADPAVWHYDGAPDLDAARREHDAFVEAVARLGARVEWHDAELPAHADAMFVHDPVLVTDGGFVELAMGKQLRRGEERALGETLTSLGLPRLGRLGSSGPVAMAESGDLVWLDARTLAVGQGFRTNREGLRQLSHLLAPLGVATLPVELPVHRGPEACLHLMSLISVVDERAAVVFPPLLPVSFHRELRARDFRLVEVPEEELATQGTNVLALEPGRLLALEGSPRTRRRLEAAGFEVETYVGREISHRAEGGPTCLTRPVLRSPVG